MATDVCNRSRPIGMADGAWRPWQQTVPAAANKDRDARLTATWSTPRRQHRLPAALPILAGPRLRQLRLLYAGAGRSHALAW